MTSPNNDRIKWLEDQIYRLALKNDLTSFDLRQHHIYFTELVDLKERTKLEEQQKEGN